MWRYFEKINLEHGEKGCTYILEVNEVKFLDTPLKREDLPTRRVLCLVGFLTFSICSQLAVYARGISSRRFSPVYITRKYQYFPSPRWHSANGSTENVLFTQVLTCHVQNELPIWTCPSVTKYRIWSGKDIYVDVSIKVILNRIVKHMSWMCRFTTFF